MVLISSFMITKLFDVWDLMTEYKNRAFQFSSDHHEPEQVRELPDEVQAKFSVFNALSFFWALHLGE